MILTIIKVHGQSTKRREILQTIKELVGKMAQQEGCVAATYYEDMDDKDIHFILEQWKTEKDLERYTRSKAYSVLLGIEALLVKPLEIQHTIQCISKVRPLVKINHLMR